MATVFSPEQLEAGLYPRPGAQHEAAGRAIEALGQLAAERSIRLSALVYGSVADPNVDPTTLSPRSDLDILVNLDDDATDEDWQVLNQALAAITRQTHVPMDLRVVTPREVAGTLGIIAGDGLFVEHLLLAQAMSPFQIGTATEGLVSITDHPPEDRPYIAAQMIMQYLVHKTGVFMAALRAEELDEHAIQRGKELPASMGRKIGRLLQLAGYIEGGISDLISKAGAEAQLASLATTDRRWGAARVLQGLNAEYSQVLAETIAGNRTIAGYRAWLVEHEHQILEQARRLTLAARRLLVTEFFPDQEE